METPQTEVSQKPKGHIEVTSEKPTDGEEKTTDLFKTTTLKELGPNLPVIQLDKEGKPIGKRSFSFKEWDMAMEEKLSKIKGKGGKTVGVFVNEMMCEILDDLGGQNFAGCPDHEKKLKINQMEFPNIMYMYIYLRVEELGSDLRLDVGCPSCGELNKDFIADLNTLEIRVKDEKHIRKATYDLVKPVVMSDKKIITSVLLDVGKWDAMEQADREVGRNAAKMKKLLFSSSIVGAFDAKGPVETFYDVDEIIKRLNKRDIEMCMRKMVENNAGPLMAVKGECVHCSVEWYKELDWSYDYFFDSSSL